MHSNCIKDLLNLKGVILKSIKNLKNNVDPGYISRMLPYLAVTNTHLPRVLCIDELLLLTTFIGLDMLVML
ncbi:MAG: hypothetical protein IKF38_07070 [Clostridia bacterium]|nr:hypothetical protein [Clostridia bacterium]